MTDFLAAQYSFHGSRNAKNSFVELNLHTVILRMYLLIFMMVVFILVVLLQVLCKPIYQTLRNTRLITILKVG